jgi:hypothetical protein
MNFIVMKKVIVVSMFLVLVLCFNFISAATTECNPVVQLLSQDSYPAIPGDYVKLVFQIEGISDSACGDITFELANKYPIVFDPGQESKVSLMSGTFVKDYSTHKLIAYKVRVDQDAVDGDNPIEILLSKGTSQGVESKQFNLFVEDTRADFEVYVKDLSFITNIVTLEVLNIAKVDVKSIAVEVLDYPNLIVKGAKTKIIGDLDSNEYTSAEFEIKPSETIVPVRIYYTDNAGFRRSIDKNVTLIPSLFQDRKADEKTTPVTSYVVGLVIILAIVYWIYKKRKAKEAKKK